MPPQMELIGTSVGTGSARPKIRWQGRHRMDRRPSSSQSTAGVGRGETGDGVCQAATCARKDAVTGRAAKTQTFPVLHGKSATSCLNIIQNSKAV